MARLQDGVAKRAAVVAWLEGLPQPLLGGAAACPAPLVDRAESAEDGV